MEADELHELLAPSDDQPLPVGVGRGIVICAGGSRLLTNAYVLVRSLRDVLGCTEDIEIWHVGANEMPALMAGTFRELGCVLVDAKLCGSSENAPIRDGWHLKLHALSYSGFAKVLMLDADQVPVADPACVFDWEEFQKTGAVFWPDVMNFVPDNPIWERLDMEPRDQISLETGQMCLDRARHHRPIAMARRMLEHQDRIGCYFHGDKDAILLAWLKCQSDYTLIPHAVFVDQYFFGQRHIDGSLLFQHRTCCKFSLHETPYLPEAFVGAATCLEFLEDLRAIWNEGSFQAPARSVAARTAEQTLVAQGEFLFKLGDRAPLVLVFLDGHQFGDGRDYHLENWHIEDQGAGGLRLIIHSRTRRAYQFKPVDEASWSGRTLDYLETAAGLDRLESESLVPPTLRGFADDLLDVALAQSDAGMFDAQGLASALRFTRTLDPETPHRIAKRLASLDDQAPEVAKVVVSWIAEAGAKDWDIGAVQRDHNKLSDIDKYRRQ
jgi:hypothetical protein